MDTKVKERLRWGKQSAKERKDELAPWASLALARGYRTLARTFMAYRPYPAKSLFVKRKEWSSLDSPKSLWVYKSWYANSWFNW